MASVASLWAESASNAGYTVQDGVPYIGVSGDVGDGHIVPVPAPAWFVAIEDQGQRDNVFRALAAHALRVGQSSLKKENDKGTREHAVAGVHAAVNGTYKPGRERANDILDAESGRMFSDHVKARVLAVKADATQADIDLTVDAQAKTDAGKALLNKFRADILARGTYTVSRKGQRTTGSVVAVGLE